MIMLRIIQIFIFVIAQILSVAQSKSSVEQYSVAGNNRAYVPMFVAHYENNKQWYTEGRYNYEDLRTFSLYIGKTFAGKNQLSYSVTPLVGGAVGDFNGVSAGLNMEADYKKFFFSLQSQYSLSTDQRQNNFFYNWSELSYQALDWLYGGVSIQQTRLYQSKTTMEPGILIGLNYRNLTLPVYAFSLFDNRNRYFMIGLTIEWERKGRKPAGDITDK